MNKDLIIKLAKLANNNPNEHEANSAARRVCKLLAEANFNFGSTWNDVKRSSEPEFKSKAYNGDNFDWATFNDLYSKINRERTYDYNKWKSKWANQHEGRYNRKEPVDYNPFEHKTKRTSAQRTCIKCGLKTFTYNQEESFICTICKGVK